MTTENRRVRRTSFKPHAFLAAFGLALACLLSPASAAAGTLPLLSSSTLTSGTDDQSTDIARDGAGSLIVVGFSSAASTGRNIWVSRWNEASLTVISSMTFNGSANGADYAQSVVLDASGNIFVMGVSSESGQGPVLWMGKFTNTLAFISSATYSIPLRSVTMYRKGLLVAPGGNLFLVNDTAGLGNASMLLAQIDPSLAFVSSTTFFSGFNSNYAFGLARDAGGNFYVAGSVAPAPATSANSWIGKFNSSLVFVASSTVAGAGGNTDEARGIVVGPDSNIYVAGYINNSATLVDLWIAKYSPGLSLLNSASYPGPTPSSKFADNLVATNDRLYAVGAVAVTGQSYNNLITEFDYSLNLLSSGTFASPGAAYDETWGLSVDTMTGKAYVAGLVTPSVPQIWVAKYQLPGYASYPGCAVTNDVGAGQPFTTIQAAVNALPPTLTGPSCVVIRDGATYNEQVTVRNFTNNGSSITIMADVGFSPLVSPPAASTAAFLIANASVNIKGIGVMISQNIPYGMWASSANVQLTNVSVSTSGGLGIYTAGVRISSWSAVSYSTVAIGNADGIWIDGGVNTTVNNSSVSVGGSLTHALRLAGASFNTITQSYFTNWAGDGVRLEGNSNLNTISLSSMTSNGATRVALNIYGFSGGASSNTITQSFISNPSGYGAQILDAGYNKILQSKIESSTPTAQALKITATGPNKAVYNLISQTDVFNSVGHAGVISFNANNNDVSLSTFVSNSSIHRALEIDTVSSTTISQTYMSNSSGYGLLIKFSTGVSVIQSKMNSSSGFGLYVDVSTGVKFLGSSAQGNPAAYIRASTNTVLSSGELVSFASGKGLWVAGGNVNFSASDIAINAVSATDGILLDNGGGTNKNNGLLSFSSITMSGPSSGLSIWGQAPGSVLTVTSITFVNMSGGTAVNILGGLFVSTFSGMNFADGAITTNVNGSTLPTGSRITMLGAFGPRAGPAYENDPFGRVDWPGFGAAGTVSPLGYTGISANSLTANWSSTYPGGTVYHLRISTSGFATYNSSGSTTNTNFFFGGLLPTTTYEVRVATVPSGSPFTGLGVSTTSASGGGALNFNFNNSDGATIASANGQNEMGLNVITDIVSGGGPYGYVIYASTPGATGSRNFLHDTAGVVGIVRYDNNGTVLSSRTLAIDSKGDMAGDNSGNVFVAEADLSLGSGSRWISKYGPNLNPLGSAVMADANVAIGPMISTGTSFFAVLEDPVAGNLQIVNYSPSLVAVATTTPFTIGSFALRGHGMARDKFSGYLYVLVSSAVPTGEVTLLKYPASDPSAFNAATPVQSLVISDVATYQYPRVAVAAGKVYVAFTDAPGTSIIVRQYDQSLNYTGFSSTITNVTMPFGKPGVAIQSDGPNIYVGGTANTGGGGDYLVMKYDANNSLAFISSATFNSNTYLSDQLRGMAIGQPGVVYVTGGSSNTISNANALTTTFSMGAGGGVGGSVSPAAYTNISTNSFVANWNTTFAAGTVHTLEISTNGFASINFSVGMTDNNFGFDGLLPATTYEVRLSTTGGAGPFTQLGVVATLSAGVSISGIVSYAGFEPGAIRIEAYPNPAYSGTPTSSQVLSNVTSQSYYLPVGAGTFYVRAYVDALGGGNYQTWLDQGTTGPFTLGASSTTDRNFSISVDSVAPNSPLGLSASPSAGQIYLTWAAPTTSTNGATLQDLRGYIIRRSTGGTGSDIAGSPSSPISSASLNFTDFSPVPNVTNIYNVIAVDFARNQSAPSSPASVSGSAGGTGGSITGHISSFTATTSGTFRVRLSSMPGGAFISESNQVFYSFSGLSTGTYYLSGFRDLNEDGVKGSFEPAGVFGGMNNNPYPIYVSGTNSSFADVTLCDRSLIQVGSPVNASLQSNGCPARDAGPDRYTNLLAFEAGTGSAGSVSTGTALTIFMTKIGGSYDSRLIVLGPGGQIVADNSSPGGAAVSVTPDQVGVYVVEPTSFYGFNTGAYTVTMNAGASGAATDGINGTLSYTGSQTGNIGVRFFTNSTFSGVPVATMSVTASPGTVSGLTYDKRYLPVGTYYVDAFRDTSGFGFNPAYQAYGQCNGGTGITVSAGNSVSIGNCVLSDPTAGSGTGSGSISGTLTYTGSPSGTLRLALFSLASDYPVQIQSPAFTASVAYSFTGLSAGTYFIRAFADANNNFVPDAGEQFMVSEAEGIGLTSGTALSGQNYTVCDRSAIADGVSQTANMTASACLSSDRPGAYMKMYTFSGTRGQSVTIDAIAQGFYGTYLALYDPEGVLAAYNDGAFDGNAQIGAFALPLDGLYTIGVSPYAPGVTGQIELSYLASNGAVGSIAGDVSYQGTQGGRIMVVLFDSPNFSSSSYIDQRILVSTRNFQFDDLFSGTSYYLGAFVDVNYNNNPDESEDKAQFGGSSPSPIFLGAGQSMTGASIIIGASTASVAGASYLTGNVYYAGAQTGQLVLEFWASSQFMGQPVAVRNVPSGIVSSSATYDVSLPGGVNYFLRAFLDANGDFIPNPSEPKGVYSPNGQGAAPIYVPASQTILDINVTMIDPGQTTGGGIAGEGTAVITNTSIGAGQNFSLNLVYTAGTNGIQVGGKVGMTVPPNYPFPNNSAFGSSITARSGSTFSGVTYSGPSVFVTLTSALLSGATMGFEWSNVYAPCGVGTATFTVTSVSNGAGSPAPLFAGSPSVAVVAGSPSFFQLSSAYFSVKQGELSDVNYLEARDSCGNKVPLTGAKTVDLRGSYYNPVLSQFSVDADVGLTTGTAVSTASAIAVDFAVGQSSRPFYVVSASTGFKNLEVHYNLQYDTTFYFGMSVLPGNALTGVFVSTTSGVTALSSATISLGASGLTNQVFVGFTLGDPQQSWRVLFSSVPFKPGVPPTPVWERWGYGQPNPGEISWDGRFNPWINGGARAPNGLYYGRVEVGGGGSGGIKDDSLRVAVSLPSFAGKIYDPAVTPNPPLSGVQLRVYGPSGYFTAVTGADGAYSMPGLGAGNYRLNLSVADYVDAVVDMTLNASGDATAFTARTVGLAVSSNATGGLDAYLGRAPRLIVVPSLHSSIAAETFDQWGSLQVRSSTGANSNTIYGPMRLKRDTTTFDDGGQWDPSTQQFVEKTLLAFNVPVGTYTVIAELSGLSRSTGTVYVGANGARLDLPAFTRKTVVTGSVTVAANPNGMGISVVAVPLSTSVPEGGFAHVFLNPGILTDTYTMGGLEAGSYMLRANAQGLSAVSLGPVAVPASGVLAAQNFPVFTAGAAISGTILTVPAAPVNSPIYMNAWAPGSFNFGSTVVYTDAGGSAVYAMPGLDSSATYQLYVNVSNNGGGGGKAEYDGGFPKLVGTGAGQNFTLTAASGVVSGTIYLQAGYTDFLNVELYGRTLASLRPERVGESFVEVSTTLPGFSCGGLPASNPSSSPVAGSCVGVSSATFLVNGVNTETLEISFLHKTTGQSSKQILSVVNGATSTFVADLSSQTFSISGSIFNQITTELFNTNPKIVDNAPFIAPLGYPAGLSSTTARVTAVRQDIDAYGVAVSTVFNPLTSRVGFIVATGTFTIANVPKGVYLVRTMDLRACATCPILVPAVGKIVSVAGASVSSVTLSLSDGYSVSGSISLDGGILDSRIFDVSVLNRRQEVVRSTVVYLGDVNQGVTANSVDYLFTNLPAGEFYTLTVRGRLFPIKYAGRPIKFPDASLSPNGLQSSLTGQNVLMQRAAYIIGRLKDGGTGESIRAANVTLLAPNFAIKATANPWTEGGYVVAASSISGRPIEGDGYFRVGPLIPDISYDLRLAQATWDPNFLASGSQNYAPVTISGLKPTPGEIRDVGVVSLGQGKSITGVVTSTGTGLALGNIKVTARPSFGSDSSLLVQTFTNSQGAYSLWVSTAVSNQFSLVAAPRDGNQASDGRYYGTVELNNVNLLTQSTAYFVLTPLPVVVTGQVVVADAATGGALSYPFGDKRGFPAAAVNLQPDGVVPQNPLGDIEVTTDERGYFTVPGLSTGLYTLHATSLEYAVFNATVQVIGSTFRIFTGSNTPSNYLPGNVLTLARGATATGRILKSDGTSPNSSEVVGVAAANFAAGEFVVGSVETDAVAKTVSAYTISGFKTGISYDLVLLSGEDGSEVSFPTEGAGVIFTASESTATKSINLTYRPAVLDCLGTAKALNASRSQFLVQVDCLKPLRQANAADDDLTTILTVSTYTAAGAALVSPNGTGVLSDPSNSTSRRLLTAIYTPATNEARFSIRIRASAAEVDPRTGDNFAIDKVFDFYAGLDASADGRATNINGGSVGMKPSAQDELLGIAERSGIKLPPGAFAEGSDSLADSAVVANPTTTVNISMSKGLSQALAKTLSIAKLGYAPAALELPEVPSAYPAEMWAAMSTYRSLASTSTVGGANPISAFYSIFLPAGIRHQLKERADLTLSYTLAASTSTTDDNIQIWFYNAVLGRFVPETTNRRLDTVNKTVTVSVDHFSTFVVLDSTPVATSTVTFAGDDIVVANFPNPADCIAHSNIARNSTLFGSGGVHSSFVGTMIRTSIPNTGTPADLRINIYSVTGEKIRTIEQGVVPVGQTYYTPWNCTNDSGRTIASGVYIGEAVHGGRHRFFKIAIIKGSGL